MRFPSQTIIVINNLTEDFIAYRGMWTYERAQIILSWFFYEIAICWKIEISTLSFEKGSLQE